MRKSPVLLGLAFFLFSSCNLGLDEKNLVGGELARQRHVPRPAYDAFVDCLSGKGLDSTRSVLSPSLWGQGGPCRFGRFKGYPFLAFVELAATRVPADFDSLYNPWPVLPSEPTGIDSIRILLYFKTGSALSRDTLIPEIRIYKARKASATRPAGTIYYLDTASLESLFVFSDTLPAPLDSTQCVVTLKPGPNPLFRYLDSLLCRRSGDTAVFPFALGLSGAPTREALFTLDPSRPPQIRFYGKRRQLFAVDSGLYHNDTLLVDSCPTFLRLLGTASTPASIKIFEDRPTLSTLYLQQPEGSDTAGYPAGYFQAEFFVNKDTLFRNLIRDSLTILGARATFFPDRDSSWSEGRTATRLYLRCRFYDRKGALVTPTHALFSAADTVLHGFSPGFDDTLHYPIDKYLAALTDPRFSEVATLAFRVAPYHNGSADTDVHLMSRTSFAPRVRITYTHTPR